jgi:DNA-binding protein YbaB
MVCRDRRSTLRPHGEAKVAQTADRDANRALRARFDEVYGQYERLRSGLDELRQRLADMQVVHRSPDGTVAAVVDSRGQLLRLHLDRRIYRDADPDALATRITETVQQASQSAARAVQELVAGYLPADSGVADYLRDGNFGALLRRTDAMRERDING